MTLKTGTSEETTDTMEGSWEAVDTVELRMVPGLLPVAGLGLHER